MLNLIIIAVLFALIFWLVRGYGRKDHEEQLQELVPDALTGVYFPKSEAITLTRGGETLYFNCIENRDKYLARAS